MVYQLTKFHVQRVDMVINPPWNLPFLGAKGLTSPEQTATGKGISNPLMAVMVCQKPYGIQLTNVSSTESKSTFLKRYLTGGFEKKYERNNLPTETTSPDGGPPVITPLVDGQPGDVNFPSRIIPPPDDGGYGYPSGTILQGGNLYRTTPQGYFLQWNTQSGCIPESHKMLVIQGWSWEVDDVPSSIIHFDFLCFFVIPTRKQDHGLPGDLTPYNIVPLEAPFTAEGARIAGASR
ncbi:hypothetical protein Tco_1284433, partial [Tanacetum coccineum]